MILFFTASILTFITQWQAENTRVATPYFIVAEDAPVVNTTSGLMDNFKDWVNANSEIVIVIWAFFFLLSCLRLVTGLAAVNRLRHYKTHPVTTEWKAKLKQLQEVIGVRCSVSLLQSELVKVPIALGVLKPLIFIPLGLLSQLPAEQVETILLHELAHIRRRDYLINLLQHITEAIYFFNPPIRWISSLIRQEREASCDDVVLASCRQKTDYLDALISFQEYSYGHHSYAVGINGKRHYLFNRVKRMVTNKNKGISFFEKIALVSGVLFISAFNYIMREPEMKNEPVIMQKPATQLIPNIVSSPEHPSVKKAMRKPNHLKKPIPDTIPTKKDTVTVTTSRNKPITQLNDQEQAAKDADATLQEIIEIKSQIGLKKGNIGLKKAQLATAGEKEKEEIQKEIDRERNELEAQRRELDRKRQRWQNLKNEAQKKPAEEKDANPKTEFKYENPTTIRNNNDTKSWVIHDDKKFVLKTNPIITHFRKKLDFKIDNIKSDRWEQRFIMNPQLKDPPPMVSPAAPAKKPKR
jgi:beta-lactamase regulating signal transducer with metallopeptidase domain